MAAQSLTDLYIQLSARGLDVVEADLAAVQRNAVFAGQAFANLAATSARGLGDMENRPRLVAAAMKVLSGETQNLGEALARMQGGGGGGGGQSGGFAGGAAAPPGGPSGGGGGTTGGGGLAKPASDLDSGMIAAAVAQLHNFTLATVAAETKTAALMYAMQSPALKGYASVLARASVVQAEFDASINLEKLKIQNESAAKYGQALAATEKEQQKFQAAVRFEQISAQSGRFAASLDALKGKMAQLGQATSSAFGGATSMIMGFVRSGLSGTMQGGALAAQMEQLSMQVASVFLPVIERVTDALVRAADWFRRLTGEQQSSLRTIGMIAAGLTLMGTILPRIIGGLQGIGVVLRLIAANPFVALIAGVVALTSTTEGWAKVLGGVVSILGKIGTLLGKLVEGAGELVSNIGSTVGGWLEQLDQQLTGGAVTGFLGDLWSGVQDIWSRLTGGDVQATQGEGNRQVTRQGGGKEDVTAAFTRFQTAALKQDAGRIPEQQLDALQQIVRNTGGMGNQPPPPPPGPPVIAPN